MDLTSYSTIIIIIVLLPLILVFIIGLIVWYCFRKSESFMLLTIMKGIISRKNIDKTPTYLICNRKLSPSSLYRFMLYLNSLFIIALCVQLCFLFAIVDVTYECINDPDMDCFKKKHDVKLSDTYAYDASPVNCSTISKDDFVICYRLTAFDPGRAFVGAAAGYLSFKMVNFALLVVAYIMLWMAQKLETKKLFYFKFGFLFFILIVILIPLTLRIFVDEVESAFRKVSYTVLFQFFLLLVVIIHFVVGLPWKVFAESDEYYGDVSLPSNVAAHDNEMT